MTGRAVVSPEEKTTQEAQMSVLHKAPSHTDRLGGAVLLAVHGEEVLIPGSLSEGLSLCIQ